MSDKPREYCGIFGIADHPEAALLSYYGLHSLQHRGQESAGIVTSFYDEEKKKQVMPSYKDFGLVNRQLYHMFFYFLYSISSKLNPPFLPKVLIRLTKN